MYPSHEPHLDRSTGIGTLCRMTNRQRRDRTEKEALIELKRAEGLTYTQLATQSGIPASTLASWKRKLDREHEPRAAEFIELRPTEPCSIEVRLPNGAAIAVQRGFDPELLRQLVQALTC